ETSDAGNGNPLAWPCFGLLEPFVGRDAGTQYRRHGCQIAVFGQARHVRGIADRVICKTAVRAIAAVVLGFAQCLPSGYAITALSASIVQPRDAYQIPDEQIAYARADLLDGAHPLVAGNEWQSGFDRPIAIHCMHIRMTDAGRQYPYQDLARTRLGNGTFDNGERLPEALGYGGTHRSREFHACSMAIGVSWPPDPGQIRGDCALDAGQTNCARRFDTSSVRKKSAAPAMENPGRSACPHFDALIEAAGAWEPVPAAIVHPCDEPSLRGAVEAARGNLIRPILVGPRQRIRRVAEQTGIVIDDFQLEDTAHSHASAARAVALARAGAVGMLVKGALHTDELISEVLDRGSGLR